MFLRLRSPRLRSPRQARDRRDRQDKLTLRRTVQVRLGFDVGFRICPSDSHPSGGFPVSDLGFITAIDDTELNSSDFAIRSPLLTSFLVDFQSAFRIPHSEFRNRRPGGTPIF
ncbi:MAG: hypothetical protein OES18_19235 [Deltaproteobacteria bacterium]|nr:hypothetical protein [Deltaproteobacteria bacterium]